MSFFNKGLKDKAIRAIKKRSKICEDNLVTEEEMMSHINHPEGMWEKLTEEQIYEKYINICKRDIAKVRMDKVGAMIDKRRMM